MGEIDNQAHGIERDMATAKPVPRLGWAAPMRPCADVGQELDQQAGQGNS